MRIGTLLTGLATILCAGCTGHIPPRPPLQQSAPMSPLVVARFGSATAVESRNIQPVSHQEKTETPLDELVALAIAHHPEVRAAHARVESARGKMVQAGLYPNLIMGPNLGQIGAAETKIAEGGARFIQTFVTAGKLRIAREAAARGVEAADWNAITKWHDTVMRVRLAYYELLTAQRELDTMAKIVQISDDAFKAATLLEKNGVGSRPDVLRARVEVEQNRLKQEVSQRRVDAAWQNLDTTLGRPGIDLRPRIRDRQALEATPPDYEWDATLYCLQQSSVLHEARALIAQQEKLLTKARADVTPNVDVQLNPFYEAPTREFRAQLIVTAPIPLFDRNQGNIHSAEADLARSIADEKNVELQLTERLTLAYQRYQAARQQVKAYRETIVRDATESLELIRKGYDGGDKKYDYTAVLQAQQVLFQTQLAQTQALGDLWRATVEIAWLLQQDHLAPSCVKER